MIRIDSHQHFWQFDPIRDAWIDDSMRILQQDFLPGALLSNLRKHEINGSIAIQADQSEDETRFLLNHANENDFILGVVGWIDLRSIKIEEKIRGYSAEQKLCGFRHIVQSENDEEFLIRDDFIRGLKFLKMYDYTYDILIYPNQLAAAIKLVNRLPDQRFVLDHIAKPYIKKGIMEPWASQLRELGSSKNVYCKLSGIITEADHQLWNSEIIKPYLDVVFDAFDTNRLMFGSDWPVCLLAGSYAQVVELIKQYIDPLPREVQGNIFGENAKVCYGIKETKEWN